MSHSLREAAGQARRYGLYANWQAGPALGALFVSGADCATFLQAQLTSNILALAPGQGQMSARLNRLGQLQAWFSLHRLPDRGQPYPSFLLLLPEREIPDLIADLNSFIITEDVLLDDMSGEFSGWVVQQPIAQEAESSLAEDVLPDCPQEVGASWVDLPENSLAFAASEAGGVVWVVRRALIGDPGFVVLEQGKRKNEGAVDSWREAAGERDMLALAGHEEAEARLLWGWLQSEAGWLRLGHDVQPGKRTLPQTGLEQQVLSTTKGCYLGQEVVARLRTYGSVPEALRAVIWRELEPELWEPLPDSGTPCIATDGTKLGTWAGTFWSAVLQMSVSLVFLNREHRTPGCELKVEVSGKQWCGEVALSPLHLGANANELSVQLYQQALTLFSKGNDEQSVAKLEDALRLDPTNVEAYESLGVILGRLEKYHEAIDIFRRLEELAPEEPMVHTNLSLFYLKIGQKDEAEQQKALATMKKFGVGTDPKQAAQMAAREREARRVEAERKKVMFAEVLVIDADDGLALMGMGQALAELEDYEGSAVHLQRALVQQDQNSALYVSCGQVLEKLERTDDAVAVFRRGIEVASRKGDLMPLREMEHRLRLLGL